MAKKCVKCNAPVSADCIELDAKLNIAYEDFVDLLVKLDGSIETINTLLSTQIDKKWILENKEYTQGYIQDIINKIDVMSKQIDKQGSVGSTKIVVNTNLVKGEKTLSQLFEILFKELETLKNRVNTQSSDLYLQ